MDSILVRSADNASATSTPERAMRGEDCVPLDQDAARITDGLRGTFVLVGVVSGRQGDTDGSGDGVSQLLQRALEHVRAAAA
jgi:hypothetical protein